MPGPLSPPDDDEIPQYSPLTMLLSGVGQQPQGDHTDQEQPQTATPMMPPSWADTSSQMAAAQPAQPTATAPQPATAAQLPGQSLPPVPQQYTPDQALHSQYEAQLAKDSAPTDRKANGPKWYDRIAGGLVGFGVGYKDGPTAGIRAGSAVTNRRYDAADADRQTRLAGDNAAMENLNRKDAEGYKGYEATMEGYRGTLDRQGVIDREQAQKDEQADRDRNFGRETQNDQRTQANQDRAFDFEKQVHGDQTKEEQTRDAEISRHNRASEGLEAANGRRSDAAAARLDMQRGEQANQLAADRKKAQDALDNGDPSKGTDGFNTQLRNLQNAKVNRATGKPYEPGEREAAINDLQTEHAQRKAEIEALYGQGMRNLGYPVQDVQYAADGKTPLNDSAGNAPGQRPPAAASPPQQAPPPPQQPPARNAPPPRKLTDLSVAKQYLKQAGGDKNKARELAKKDGYEF